MAKKNLGKWTVSGECACCGNPILLRGLATDAPETKRTCACLVPATNVITSRPWWAWPYYTNPGYYLGGNGSITLTGAANTNIASGNVAGNLSGTSVYSTGVSGTNTIALNGSGGTGH